MSSLFNQQLAEKYRPQTWSEVIGQEKVIKQLEVIRKRSGTLASQVFWISGQSGTGKTTIARLIAKEVAEEWSTTEFSDPTELTPAVCIATITSPHRVDSPVLLPKAYR